MEIPQIIAGANTTSNNHVQQLTNGTTEAILTFNTRKTADRVARQLRAAGAKARVTASPYSEYILTANWS